MVGEEPHDLSREEECHGPELHVAAEPVWRTVAVHRRNNRFGGRHIKVHSSLRGRQWYVDADA